jgi:transcriptional regulator with XRE-family HTH domain
LPAYDWPRKFLSRQEERQRQTGSQNGQATQPQTRRKSRPFHKKDQRLLSSVETIVAFFPNVKRAMFFFMSAPEEILNALINVLSQERKRRGLTFEDLSSISGLHRTTLGLYERGERGPTVEAALNLAHALDIPLSELLRKAENQASGKVANGPFLSRREVPLENFKNSHKLRALTGLSIDAVRKTIIECYKTLDNIDDQLVAYGSEPIARLVEPANLSSMIGNILGAGLAKASNGLYERNRPHAYPDLIAHSDKYRDLEIKIALEKNKPKGHLPKPGNYVSFRYVLCNDKGSFTKGKDNRGTRVFIWEVKIGSIEKNDFDMSNTEGDSGKTAVIKTAIFNSMSLVYFDRDLLPYLAKEGRYPGFN